MCIVLCIYESCVVLGFMHSAVLSIMYSVVLGAVAQLYSTYSAVAQLCIVFSVFLGAVAQLYSIVQWHSWPPSRSR